MWAEEDAELRTMTWVGLPWEMGRRKEADEASFYFLERSRGLKSEWTNQV